MKTKPLSPNMAAVLAYIRTRYAETGKPVTHMDMRHVVGHRHLVATRVALIDRGLIAPVSIGVAAWIPTSKEGAS